jgi:hypothetical protein
VPRIIDPTAVSTAGLESCNFAEALGGLRASEARYLKNHHDMAFETYPANERQDLVDYLSRILLERDIVIAAKPLEVAEVYVDGMRWTFCYYESGLAINAVYSLETNKKRAVGIKLSVGMEVPEELASKFKFARMKSKLAGEVRGSYFVIKGEY